MSWKELFSRTAFSIAILIVGIGIQFYMEITGLMSAWWRVFGLNYSVYVTWFYSSTVRCVAVLAFMYFVMVFGSKIFYEVVINNK